MGYYSTIQDLPKIKKVEEFNKEKEKRLGEVK